MRSKMGAVSSEQLETIYGHFGVVDSPILFKVKRLPMIWS